MSQQKTDPYMDVLDELRALTLKKRRGYSPGDDPFKNFRMSSMFGVDPVVGILIRTMDKMARIASLLENPDNDQVGESIRDTLLDAGNYPLIAVAYLDSEKAKRDAVNRIGAEPFDSQDYDPEMRDPYADQQQLTDEQRAILRGQGFDA